MRPGSGGIGRSKVTVTMTLTLIMFLLYNLKSLDSQPSVGHKNHLRFLDLMPIFALQERTCSVTKKTFLCIIVPTALIVHVKVSLLKYLIRVFIGLFYRMVEHKERKDKNM